MMATCLSGCVGEVVTVNINDDMSGTMSIKAGFTYEALERIADMSGDETATDLSELESFTYNGVTYYGETQEETFSNINELNELFSSSNNLLNDEEMSEAVQGNAADLAIVFAKNSDNTITMTMNLTPPDKSQGIETAEGVEQGVDIDMSGMEEMAEEMVKDMAIVMTFNFPATVKQTAGPSPDGINVNGKTVSIDLIKAGADIENEAKLVFTTAATVAAIKIEQRVFTDVASEAWYCKPIEAMAEKGIINGMGDGKFAPDGTITYAQFCNIAAKSEGLDFGTENGYWGYKAIQSCLAKGYIDNLGAITAKNYDVPMTSEAAVAAMARIYANRLQKDTEYLPITGRDIPDYSTISSAYQKDIVNAYNAGITNGVDQNKTFSPKSSLTRAQVCQLFYNVQTQLGLI